MSTVPFASIGVWLGLWLTRKPLSQPVFIGMILLCGYVVNAAIILIDRMNALKREGLDTETALIQAGRDRLRPILMTTVSTVVGFLPMALNWGEGSELWSPLAVTVIGGLLTATLLTLFVVPAVVLFFEKVGAWLKEHIFSIRALIRGGAPESQV